MRHEQKAALLARAVPKCRVEQSIKSMRRIHRHLATGQDDKVYLFEIFKDDLSGLTLACYCVVPGWGGDDD